MAQSPVEVCVFVWQGKMYKGCRVGFIICPQKQITMNLKPVKVLEELIGMALQNLAIPTA